MKFTILDPDYDPECVCCPVRGICMDTEPGVPVNITKDIKKRSGCDGEVFETWDIVGEDPYAPYE
ncbi:MAG: hypothetical protein M0Q91_16270 [Methanoregula sp.]|jgi:hypothetical protein|nr:hypothetical protein [Methanoregula sp.]